MEAVQDFITQAIADYGYIAILLLMLASSACIPVPSEVVMLFGGAAASAGFAEAALGAGADPLSFWWVFFWGTVGSLMGSWLAYWLGYAGGRPVIDRWGRYLLFRPHEVDRAHEWFERHGEPLVLFGRMVPLLRAFVSLPAGIAKMDLRKFTIFTIFGIIPWDLSLCWLGYSLGERWHVVERFLQPLAVLAAVVLVGIITWWIVKRVRQRRADQVA